MMDPFFKNTVISSINIHCFVSSIQKAMHCALEMKYLDWDSSHFFFHI